MNEDVKRAYSHSLYLLDEKSYSAKKMREKLSAKYSDDVAEAVIGRLTAEGYINDLKFAAHAAEYMREVKKFGAYRIKQELLAKGIDRETAAEVCKNLESDETEAIKARIRKGYSDKLGTPAGEGKVQAAMQRYGFKYSDVARAIRELKEELITI
ncbi:MAG: recombination regulator RecX [Ruminococcus sp.]|jgi:regulatory protein|nr:recombination regulator RecX [Ruminococcus sp.]